MSKELKTNPMLKMLLPTAVKMLQNPALKAKLLSLISEQKAKFTLDDGLDLRILLSAVQDEMFAKVVLYNICTNQVIEVVEIYTFEELVEMLTKLV